MKRIHSSLFFAVCILLPSLTSCHRTSREVWEDTKTCSRYLGKGMRSLLGQHIDPREYTDYDMVWEQNEAPFIPLSGGESMELAAVHDLGEALPPPKDSPGDPGSLIPGIESFSSPLGALASIFQTINFETDNYSIKGDESLHTLRTIANYLVKNRNTFVFIEGHADERGASAYNLALGSKRANSIRGFLIQNGAHPDQLFTISYGKERPLALGHDETAWQKNRRGQFKIYAKK